MVTAVSEPQKWPGDVGREEERGGSREQWRGDLFHRRMDVYRKHLSDKRVLDVGGETE